MAIRFLAIDVDGTLTDGKIYIGETGEVMKAFNVKDGHAICKTLPANGVTPVFITGRESAVVENRARELGVDEVYQRVSDKAEVLRELAVQNNISFDEIAYIGDDINDLPCIEICGFTACPRDAADEVKARVRYVCKNKGGEGAVREFVDVLCRGE
jgi:3-deoxy-D-manno-octulosonate 8-phosphate phosphatase (KDO 8-P phosphatase)